MTVTSSKYARRDGDLYTEEPWATEALLRRFPMAGLHVWEPAAGRHSMAGVLRGAGARVTTSDTDGHRRHDFRFDFLAGGDPPVGRRVDAIVSNPPYGPGNRDAVRFLRLALARCEGTVALLLTAKFDHAKGRVDVFRDCPRFRAKIALVDRIAFFDGQSGTEDHAWFIWGPKGNRTRPTMFWEGREPS